MKEQTRIPRTENTRSIIGNITTGRNTSIQKVTVVPRVRFSSKVIEKMTDGVERMKSNRSRMN